MDQTMDHQPTPGRARRRFTTQEGVQLPVVMSTGLCQDWGDVAKQMPPRTPRQCRELWMNYLNPRLSSTPWTQEEDELLEKKMEELGRRWPVIASSFSNRSRNQIKNRWFARARQMERKYSPKNQDDEDIDSLFEISELE
jgi:hypothetical protein